MKVEEILQRKVSLARSLYKKAVHVEVTIETILFDICERWKYKVLDAREAYDKYGKEAYTKKKVQFPVWFPHGVTGEDDKDENMVSFSNIIALDIDVDCEKNINVGLDMEDLRTKLMQYPSVFAALKSSSGKGIYVLVAVEDYTHTRGYYEWWKGILLDKYNAVLDMSGTNYARKRFISWEEDMEKWIKPMDAEIIPWKLYLKEVTNMFKPTEVKATTIRRHTQTDLFGEDFQLERTRNAIRALINAGLSSDDFNHSGDGAYGHWWWIGNNIKYFFDNAEGEMLFVKFSQNSSTYHDNIETCLKCFRNCDGSKALFGGSEDDLHRKWQGMAKNKLGVGWWRNLNS